MLTYRQGQHAKAHSIITEEFLKAYLRWHCPFSFKDLEAKLPLAIMDEFAPCLEKKTNDMLLDLC